MAITIGREQRDAIHGELMPELTGSGDVYLEIEAVDFDRARATRRRLEDAMRLLDDPGWDPEAQRHEFEITMPPGDLARRLGNLNDRARSVVRASVVEPIEQHRDTLRTVTAQDAYAGLLAELVESASGTTGVHPGDHDCGYHACGPSHRPSTVTVAYGSHCDAKLISLIHPLQVVVRLRGQRPKHSPSSARRAGHPGGGWPWKRPRARPRAGDASSLEPAGEIGTVLAAVARVFRTR